MSDPNAAANAQAAADAKAAAKAAADKAAAEAATNLANKRMAMNQAQVDEVVEIMKMNVDKVLDRDAKLSQLDERADFLQNSAGQFEKSAGSLKNKFWLKNLKMMIISGIIGTLFVVIVGYWLYNKMGLNENAAQPPYPYPPQYPPPQYPPPQYPPGPAGQSTDAAAAAAAAVETGAAAAAAAPEPVASPKAHKSSAKSSGGGGRNSHQV